MYLKIIFFLSLFNGPLFAADFAKEIACYNSLKSLTHRSSDMAIASATSVAIFNGKNGNDFGVYVYDKNTVHFYKMPDGYEKNKNASKVIVEYEDSNEQRMSISTIENELSNLKEELRVQKIVRVTAKANLEEALEEKKLRVPGYMKKTEQQIDKNDQKISEEKKPTVKDHKIALGEIEVKIDDLEKTIREKEVEIKKMNKEIAKPKAVGKKYIYNLALKGADQVVHYYQVVDYIDDHSNNNDYSSSSIVDSKPRKGLNNEKFHNINGVVVLSQESRDVLKNELQRMISELTTYRPSSNNEKTTQTLNVCREINGLSDLVEGKLKEIKSVNENRKQLYDRKEYEDEDSSESVK